VTTATNPYESPQVSETLDPSQARRDDLRYYGFGASNVLLGALAMLGTLPGRTHGLGLITEYLLTDMQLDRNTFSLINLVATLIGGLACFPAGALVDRLGTRWSLALVSAALGATCFLMAGVYGVVSLFVLVTLTRALGQSALSVVSMAVVGKWFKRHVGVAMSVYSVLVSLFFVAAFVLVGMAVLEWGWRTAWAIIGMALMFGLAPLAALAVRSRPESLHAETDELAADAASLGGFSFAEALRTPAFWVFALAASFYGLVSSGMGLWNQGILAEHKFDATAYHNLLGFSTLMSLAGQLLAGVLGWRVPMGRLLAGAMFLYAAALLWLTQIESFFALQLYAVMMGIAGGMVMVLFFAIWPQAFGRASLGRIQGAAQMLTVVASAVGPLLFSSCHEVTGSYSPALYAIVPIVVLLGVAAWVVRTPHRVEPARPPAAAL
jgi:MFS family permease